MQTCSPECRCTSPFDKPVRDPRSTGSHIACADHVHRGHSLVLGQPNTLSRTQQYGWVRVLRLTSCW